MQIVILGSSAGGGFPQWNCHCSNCHRLRSGELHGRARTQSSLAVSEDGRHWLLINASPDLRQQMEMFPPLRRASAARGTAVDAVLLTDSQVDHASGLLLLRESPNPLEVYCTETVHRDLCTGLPLLKALESYCGYHWNPLAKRGAPFHIDALPGIEVSALPLGGKGPPYSSWREEPYPGHNIALRFFDRRTGRSALYSPSVAELDDTLMEVAGESDLWLLDGTLWSDDELIRNECGRKHGTEMGHLALGGEQGLIARAASLTRPRKILVHVNNTNPVLDEDSGEFRELTAKGFEVAHDGDWHEL